MTMSCGVTLQMSDLAADVGGLALSVAKSHWHGAFCTPHTRAVHAASCLEREVAGRENW